MNFLHFTYSHHQAYNSSIKHIYTAPHPKVFFISEHDLDCSYHFMH